MAYSKSPRPYRRYSVLVRHRGAAYLCAVRAHDMNHAQTLAGRQMRRAYDVPASAKLVMDVFEGTVRRATS